MKFSKYHGCGNNFIIIEDANTDYSQLALKMCNHFIGIGGDGLLILKRNPCSMRIFNCDGSEATMCGNGLRCLLCYCIDQGMSMDELREVNTKAGIMKVLEINTAPFSCTIDVGKPSLKSEDMAINTEAETFLHQKLFIGDQLLDVSCVYTGAVHAVLYTDLLTAGYADRLGSLICHHPLFKNQTNVDFVRIIHEHQLELITYERGVGVTQACGTGACAAAYMAAADGKCKSPITIKLPYGELLIEINDSILMYGTAIKIAEGNWQEY